MKLICINEKDQINSQMPKIHFGEEVTVSETMAFPTGTFYRLVEYPPIKVNGRSMFLNYKADLFATLPGVESEVIDEEAHESIIYQR